MSKLVADNLRAMTAAVETPMVYPVRGSAKAWANLNGTGTIALRDSLNVSSTVDNGTGDYTLNWSTVFANANYLTTSGFQPSATANWAMNGLYGRTASLQKVMARSDAGAAFDYDTVGVASMGALA
jgi:hypothetical protein